MPTKTEEKVQVQKEIRRKGLHIPMLIYGGEGNIGRKSCVVQGIEHQQYKKEKNDGTTEDGGVRSPMSVTRSKQGIEEGGGITPMCLRPFRSKALRDGWYIFPMH